MFVDIQRMKYNHLVLREILPEKVRARHSDNFFACTSQIICGYTNDKICSKDCRLNEKTKRNAQNQTNISFALVRRIVTNMNNISLSRKKSKRKKEVSLILQFIALQTELI